jgi:alpha-ketoglutarate-dependent taurine dioxygenase
VTLIFDQVITDPAAWESAKVGGRAGFVRRLTSAEVDAIDTLGASLSHKAVHAISRSDFADPVVDALMAEVRQQVMQGRGAILLSGIDPDRHTPAQFERLYWGLGTLMDVELRPHTDMHEVMSLACVSRAAEGGASTLVSSLAVHNAIRATHPEFLAALYEGFWAGINESIGGGRPLSDHEVPIFCCVDGKVSCYYNKFFMHAAAKRLGMELPPDLVAAMNWFDVQAMRADLGATFVLQPGEMLFWHNWTCLHARTAFRDAPGAKRLLLRLWLNVPDGRPVHPEIAERARRMDEDHFARAG